jgi:hypothetical protein
LGLESGELRECTILQLQLQTQNQTQTQTRPDSDTCFTKDYKFCTLFQTFYCDKLMRVADGCRTASGYRVGIWCFAVSSCFKFKFKFLLDNPVKVE